MKASNGKSKKINEGSLNLNMRQDIIQKVADKHPLQGETLINDRNKECKAKVPKCTKDNLNSTNKIICPLILIFNWH